MSKSGAAKREAIRANTEGLDLLVEEAEKLGVTRIGTLPSSNEIVIGAEDFKAMLTVIKIAKHL